MAFIKFPAPLVCLASAIAVVACSSSDSPKAPNPFDADFSDCPVDAGTDVAAPPDVSMPDRVGVDSAAMDDASVDTSANDRENAETSDEASCAPVFACYPSEGAFHLPICSPTNYLTNPPSSGNHYGIWAAYKTYTKPFPSGFWVHDLEHGAVVLLYNCPGGCDGDVARIQAFIDKLPADCGTPPRRIVLLPDPDLDVRFAASAWGFTLKGECFDEAPFGAFVAAHYGHGLEDICSDGLDPLTAGNGGTPLCP